MGYWAHASSSVPLTFALSGSVTGAGALAGISPLVFTGAAATSPEAVMVGACALTFTCSATLLLPEGIYSPLQTVVVDLDARYALVTLDRRHALVDLDDRIVNVSGEPS